MPRYEEVTQRAGSLRALSGLTDAEFQALLPHFEQAFVTYMQDRTIDGQPRTSRRYSTYDNCPLPTTGGQTALHSDLLETEPHSRGARTALRDESIECEQMDSRAASRVNRALADQELLPARTAAEFAAMFKTQATDGRSTTPLFGMMALNVRSTARPIPKSNKNITVARRSVTRSKTSS